MQPNSKFSKLNILSEDSTNMIDSNKTITRLSTVVKELIENSIDAGSSNISILIKDGGLNLIELKDDGAGISKENFNKLCQRFNSSKLEKYDDISSINTFGFRGEALSILSYISHLTILSKTENSQIGYEAVFKNGKIVNSQRESLNLKAVPCEKGTVIKVENIFYNNLIRKKYYDKNEETKEIISLVSKYAFHFDTIRFNLSSNVFSNKIIMTNLKSQQEEDKLVTKRILTTRLFNQEITDNLFMFDNNTPENENDISSLNLKNDIQFVCYFTKPSANLDKSLLMIFLNNRLITNNNIKKLLDGTYSKFLIKNGNYFVYLNLTCPTSQIDVNVRANKSEVLFLDEDKFLLQLKVLLEENLKEEINSKNYYVGEYSNFSDFKKKDKDVLYQGNQPSYYAKDKVRVDTKTVTLEKYIKGLTTKKEETNSNVNNYQDFNCLKTIFDSLFNSENKNYHFTEIIKNHFYVGYECKNNIIFLQYNTSLYVLNTKFILEEYFLYLILQGKNEAFVNLKIKSNYNVNNILEFIEDNCLDLSKNQSGFKFIDDIRKNINSIIEIFKEKHPLFKYLNISISENLQIEEIFLINLIKSNPSQVNQNLNNLNFKRNFLCYLPLIYYSMIEHIYLVYIGKRNTNYIQANDSLNLMIDSAKIYSHYLSNYYIEILTKLPTEDADFILRDCLLNAIKIDKEFFIRKNVKEEDILEKVIDTETLYTVFERC